jgi:hypothetical protein
MKAWPSLTDTSVVKIYREVPALRNNAFREFARCLNLLSRNKFASLLYGLDRQACPTPHVGRPRSARIGVTHDSTHHKVEAIGTYSNSGHLCKKFADLRKRIEESAKRSPLLRHDGPPTRSKRFLTSQDVTDIVHKYESGDTTQQIGTCYGISKTRVATVLREQGITIRRQGLSDVQVDDAATLYTAGKSLAWLGAHCGVSQTTVATALRRQGLQLRPPRAGSEVRAAMSTRLRQRSVLRRSPNEPAS